MNIEPIKGAVIHCHHQPGDPDCDCYPECPECGNSYDPEEGHFCGEDDPCYECTSMRCNICEYGDSEEI